MRRKRSKILYYAVKKKRVKLQMGREAFLPENYSNCCSIQTWKIQLWLLAIKFKGLQASVKYLTTIAIHFSKQGSLRHILILSFYGIQNQILSRQSHSNTSILPNTKSNRLTYYVSHQGTSSNFPFSKLRQGSFQYFHFTDFETK